MALNVEFATRLHSVNSAAARSDGSILILGDLFLITVVLNSGNAPPDNFVIDESAYTKTNDTSGFTDPDTYEQHVSLRTPGVVVPLNQPVILKLSMKAGAFALDNGMSDVEFATLGLPTGIDVFTLPAGVTVNAPGSFLFNNRFLPPTLTSLNGDFSIIGSPVRCPRSGSHDPSARRSVRPGRRPRSPRA